MVEVNDSSYSDAFALSVLALSSRFDGHKHEGMAATLAQSFSTRSVESF